MRDDDDDDYDNGSVGVSIGDGEFADNDGFDPYRKCTFFRTVATTRSTDSLGPWRLEVWILWDRRLLAESFVVCWSLSLLLLLLLYLYRRRCVIIFSCCVLWLPCHEK